MTRSRERRRRTYSTHCTVHPLCPVRSRSVCVRVCLRAPSAQDDTDHLLPECDAEGEGEQAPEITVAHLLKLTQHGRVVEEGATQLRLAFEATWNVTRLASDAKLSAPKGGCGYLTFASFPSWSLRGTNRTGVGAPRGSLGYGLPCGGAVGGVALWSSVQMQCRCSADAVQMQCRWNGWGPGCDRDGGSGGVGGRGRGGRCTGARLRGGVGRG